jgi:mRNA interferase MazF
VYRLTTPGATGLDVVSTVRLDQMRTVDRQRLIKPLGKVDHQSIRRVDEAIKISLGLIQI